MRTLILALVIAAQLPTADAARVAGPNPVASSGDGRLVIAGVPMHHNAANYQTYIKFLTVSPKLQKHPAFRGTNIRAIHGLECPLRQQIYQAMNWNRAERFTFATLRQAQENFNMRLVAISFMFRMAPGRYHDIDFGYAGATVPQAADRAHWIKVATWNHVTLKGTSASESLDGLVKNKFRGECLAAMQINVLYAARKALGAKRFDRIHANGLGIGGKSKSASLHTRLAASNSPRDMVPGDWAYIKNKPDYNHPTLMRPGGKLNYWAGENAVYLGRFEEGAGEAPVFSHKSTQRFSGMGAYAKSEAELVKLLKKAYLTDMRPPHAYRTHTITDADIKWTGTQRLVPGP